MSLRNGKIAVTTMAASGLATMPLQKSQDFSLRWPQKKSLAASDFWEIAGSSQPLRPQVAAAARFRGRNDHGTVSNQTSDIKMCTFQDFIVVAFLPRKTACLDNFHLAALNAQTCNTYFYRHLAVADNLRAPGTTLRQALRGHLPLSGLRGLCRGLFEGSTGLCGGPRDFLRAVTLCL